MPSQNSINNTIKDNNFVVNLNTAGSSSVTLVNHLDNTNTSSNAELLCKVAGANSGDPYIYFNIPSGADYSLGIDNSTTNDNFVVTDSTSPSSGNLLYNLNVDGNLRLPKSSAYAYSLVRQNAVTGDGTTYTITADTEYFDQNTNFSGSTFTAPVTGKYLIKVTMNTIDWSTQTGTVTTLTTSNQTYNSCYFGNARTLSDVQMFNNMAILADMDSGDTASVSVTVSGGTKVVDVRINFGPIEGILVA